MRNWINKKLNLKIRVLISNKPAGSLNIFHELRNEFIPETWAKMARVKLHVPLQYNMEKHLCRRWRRRVAAGGLRRRGVEGERNIVVFKDCSEFGESLRI